MQVILLQDVSGVGKKFDIAEVKPGFARNFLFTKGYAEAVTKANAGRVAELTRKREEEVRRQREALTKALGGIKKLTLTFKRKANPDGGLYAAVTGEEIAEELAKATGSAFTAEHVALEKPLKALGEFVVRIEYGGKDAGVTVAIVADESGEAK